MINENEIKLVIENLTNSINCLYAELVKTNQTNAKLNLISVADVSCESHSSSLAQIEQTINRLLKKHKNFLLMSKKNKILFGERTTG
jgi:hypothetical protein